MSPNPALQLTRPKALRPPPDILFAWFGGGLRKASQLKARPLCRRGKGHFAY
jgi:hypothetical protein